MKLVSEGYRYVLYDHRGFVLIITRCKSIALNIIKSRKRNKKK